MEKGEKDRNRETKKKATKGRKQKKEGGRERRKGRNKGKKEEGMKEGRKGERKKKFRLVLLQRSLFSNVGK